MVYVTVKFIFSCGGITYGYGYYLLFIKTIVQIVSSIRSFNPKRDLLSFLLFALLVEFLGFFIMFFVELFFAFSSFVVFFFLSVGISPLSYKLRPLQRRSPILYNPHKKMTSRKFLGKMPIREYPDGRSRRLQAASKSS